MREMVGKRSTLSEMFKNVEIEEDEDYMMAYIAMIQSTLSFYTKWKVKRRTTNFAVKQVMKLISNGVAFEDINDSKMVGYKEDYVLALKDAVEWEMSLFGRILRLILGRDQLGWDRDMIIEEVRR